MNEKTDKDLSDAARAIHATSSTNLPEEIVSDDSKRSLSESARAILRGKPHPPARIITPRPAQPTCPKDSDPFLRAENEDDDGYDPYSDRPAANPFFERDPWD